MKKLALANKVLFYSSRILNVIVLSFILLFVIAHLIGEEDQMGGFNSRIEVVMFICFPIVTILGLVIAWKWELLGGLISCASIMCLFSLNPQLISNLPFWMICTPGILHIISSQVKSYFLKSLPE